MSEKRNIDFAANFVEAIPQPVLPQREDPTIYDAGRKYNNMPVDGRTLAGLMALSLIVGGGFGWFALMVSGQKPLAVLVAFGILAGFMWHMRDSITGDRLALRESDNKRREEDARTAAWERVEKRRLGVARDAIEAHREIETMRIGMQQAQIEANRQIAHSMKPAHATLPESTFVSNVDQSLREAGSKYLTHVYINKEYGGEERRLNCKGWPDYVDPQDLEDFERMLMDGPIKELRSKGGTIYGHGLVHANLEDALNSLPSPTRG